ncbi:MAG: class I SAM-dependent methyltransferase [Lachnospiraceae bacterium]|jgi:SAM-dependent methyltransferase|nr:class I SAM-dependent methyltransferase [Lachnospiraceae bacterium]
MEAYTGFAEVYDLFMDNVPYGEWGRYLVGLLREYQVSQGIVLELGCGTGKMTRLLAAAGYDMIGIDNSQEMLQVAREASEEPEKAFLASVVEASGVPEEAPLAPDGEGILYLLQDMQEFELYGTVRAVVSVCDSMNYILEEEGLLRVFSLVNNYLDPGGVFIFDLNTPYKYRELLGESVVCENRPEGSFIWENFFDEEEQVNQYDLTLFIREDGSGGAGEGLYRKYEETHFQRAYGIGQVKSLLEQAGMEFIAVYDAFTHNPPKEDSERVYFIARERGKPGNQANF